MQNKFSLWFGYLLIGCGILLLLNNFDIIRFGGEKIWPFFLLMISFLFFGLYNNNKALNGVVIPGGILFVISGIFLICVFWGWDNMDWLWPFFILAPAFGLFLFFLITGIHAILIPVSILTVIGLLFLGLQSAGWYTWPIVLILTGIFLIIKPGIFRSIQKNIQ
jgi:hypothetical protein